jgi:hypothetical protein
MELQMIECPYVPIIPPQPNYLTGKKLPRKNKFGKSKR